MREKAIQAMLELGISANTRGFTYIADAMELFHEKEEMKYKICKLYEEIADKYEGITASSVERAIRHAFHDVYNNAPVEELEKWLTTRGRQSNGNLLAILYIRLKKKCL